MSDTHSATEDKVEPLLLDANRVSRLLAVSTTTLRRLVADRAVPPPLRLGGAIKWRVSDIRQWVEQGCPRTEDAVE